MLKHILRYSSLSLALWTTGALAQPTPAQLEYTKFKTQNLGEIQLETGTRLAYEIMRRETKGTIEVITAKLLDPYAGDLPRYQNLVITLDSNSQQLQAFAETSEGHFHLNNGAEDPTRLWQKDAAPAQLDSLLLPPKTSARTTKSLKTSSIAPLIEVAPLALGEKDASGRYVIDVFIGFSTAAAAYVGNLDATAQMYIETVNTALTNSKVDNVYLRLVGTGVSPQNPGVITSVLSDGKVWFKDDIARTAPDLLGLIQMPTNAEGSAGGWAGVGGDSHVIAATLPSAYRHEVGHNVGGVHCKGPNDTGYHFGFSVRQGRGTAQCGNDLAFYSSPLIKDDEGNVLGTEHSQDMARKWRERAAEMSANRIHKIPFPSDNHVAITLQAEDYTGFSDTTVGNTGAAYRNDNVDIQTTSDTGGGHNVGWIEKGEWLAYKVTIPNAGKYEVSYRVASLNSQGRIQLEQQGGSKIYGTIDLPITGGWQNWTTLSHEVELSAGEQYIALAIKAGNFNLNWIKLEKVATSLGTYRLQNVWQPTQFIHIEKGTVEAGDVPAGYWSSQWNIMPVTGTQYVRMSNVWKPTQSLYIHNGALASGATGTDNQSSHWALEKVDTDVYRLRNRQLPDQYINMENNRLQVSTAQPGWWSAHWKFITAQ